MLFIKNKYKLCQLQLYQSNIVKSWLIHCTCTRIIAQPKVMNPYQILVKKNQIVSRFYFKWAAIITNEVTCMHLIYLFAFWQKQIFLSVIWIEHYLFIQWSRVSLHYTGWFKKQNKIGSVKLVLCWI